MPVAVRLCRDYRIASPSDWLELKKQAGQALDGKKRKARKRKKRFFAGRQKLTSHIAFLEREAKRQKRKKR